ncbi:MAG: flagellar biosynthesis regulator FlaF, partial [Phycisphaerales bacterium]
MQNLAAQTYQQTAQATVSPRSLEADLLTKAAVTLQRIADDWDGRSGELAEALTYNRKLWQIFVASVTDKTNPLPDP